MSQAPTSSETQVNSSLEFISRSSDHIHIINSRDRAVVPVVNSKMGVGGGDIVLEHCSGGGGGGGEVEGGNYLVIKNPFWFETSQMVMDRILSHSQEVSPRTSASGRLSHSSGSLNAADTPPFSPLDIALDDFKIYRPNYPLNSHLRATVSGSGASSGGGKTVGRWLKERKEKRKEENRTQNAQLHAAVSVAGVAAAIAAIASASANNDDGEQVAKTDIAMASAATLVAAQCVEAAEAMGAEHDHLASVISSAVNVKSAGDIMTLTAAAATALRGAATLKSRALKDVYNAAATAMPGDRGFGASSSGSSTGKSNDNINNNIIINQIQRYSGELLPDDSFLGVCHRGVLANGWELLKRTRNGDLHWKIVSVYINRMNQVMLKMKSRHVAGTITKKKKNMVVDVVKDIPAWPGRHLLEGGDDRRYFGLKTEFRGVVEFECRNQREYDLWTQGVAKLLSMVSERNNRYRG